MNLQRYHNQLPYSYVFGAFGTIELLKNQKDKCLAVLVDSSFCQNDAYQRILKLCENTSIEIIIQDDLIKKIRDKGNIYVIGVFKKYEQSLSSSPHVLIYGINDVGTIGTIVRSMLGFNFENLALIHCDIDPFDIHLIRSTMGAYFSIHVVSFSSLEEYLQAYPNQKIIHILPKKAKPNFELSSYFQESLSLLFSKEPITTNFEMITYPFDKDISFENIVNVILFQLFSYL